MKLNIKKGDTVVILSGRNKGKKGKVLRVIKSGETRLVVEGVNLIKKHQKPSRNSQGGIIEKPAAIAYSKVKLVCPRCHKPARVARENKKRVCKKCRETIDKD